MPTHPSRTASLVALIALLLPLPTSLAQNVQLNAPLTLHITILEGDNALNNIRERTAREPIVQVEDANHKPVAGVAIVFTSLRGSNGAGGTFNSLPSYKTVTDAQGRAVGRGFQPNTTTGQYTISVQAAVGTMMAAIVIHEENTLAKGGGAGADTTQLIPSSTPVPGTAKPGAATPTATGGSHLLHIIHLIPKWAIVGVAVGGTALGVAIATQNPSGAVISSGGGSVTAPAARPSPNHR